MNTRRTRGTTPTRSCAVVMKSMSPCPSTPPLSKDLKKTINEKNLLTTRSRKKIIDALDEIDNDSNAASKNKKRAKVINEILTSEKNYINQLEKIVTYFMKPCEEKKLLKPNEFDTLFGNIKIIHNVNKTLLVELQRKDVAKAFCTIAPYLKLYSTFAYDYKKCLKVLQDYKGGSSQFSKFLEAQETRPEVQSKLSALLITPIQRIPRYRLLLEELLNHTLANVNSKEYASLKSSLQRVVEAADHINKIVDEQENAQRLLELQRCMKHSEPNIIVPGRKLIKEGFLLKVNEKGGPSEKLYVVLTNDIILYCKVRTEEIKLNSLKCSHIYPLNKCRVSEILDKGCFRVTCQDQEIVLYQKQLSETKEWIKIIKDTIEQYVDNRKTLRKESSARRPVKRKDLNEYHDVGLSPGKPLKKRRHTKEEEESEEPRKEQPAQSKKKSKDSKLPLVSKRKPIRRGDIFDSVTSTTTSISTASRATTPSVTSMLTTRASFEENIETASKATTESEDDKMDDDKIDPVYTDSEEADEKMDAVEEENGFEGETDIEGKELVLYGKADENNSGITAKVGSLFGGIKRLFGFR